MGLPQAPDVSRFGVRAGWRIDSRFANLARVPVKFLYLLCHLGVAHQALNGRRSPCDGADVLLRADLGRNRFIVGD